MPAMRKKRTLPKSFTGTTQMPDAPQLPGARRTQTVPPAKGSPVAPPPMWNYEAKDGEAPAPHARQGKHAKRTTGSVGATGPVAASEAARADEPEKAPAVDPKKAEEEAEDLAALLETSSALDELSREMALLEELVDRLPE
jgi:hypothetical protein